MLLGTLSASPLENILTGKRMNREVEGFIRVVYGSSIKNKDFYYRLILYLILKYKSIIKMNLDLMVFILEIIYQI